MCSKTINFALLYNSINIIYSFFNVFQVTVVKE